QPLKCHLVGHRTCNAELLSIDYTQRYLNVKLCTLILRDLCLLYQTLCIFLIIQYLHTRSLLVEFQQLFLLVVLMVQLQ
ncbi:GSCOCG00011104001-RA-CDS, partial [Cotesia congregata]